MLLLMSGTESTICVVDNTLYAASDNVNDVIKILENYFIRLCKGFSDSQMRANKDKHHLFVRNNEEVSVKIADIWAKSIDWEKVFGIIIDSKLNFKDHLHGFIKSTSKM